MVEKVNQIEDKNEKDEIGRVSINEEKLEAKETIDGEER